MELIVRKKHFDAAIKMMPKTEEVTTACLVAQAAKDLFPGKKVSVSYTNIRIGNGKRRKDFLLPKAVTDLINRFDNSFSFADWSRPTKAEKTRLAKIRESLPRTFTLTQ